MHSQLRHARFNLIVFGSVLGVALIAYLILLLNFGPKVALAAFGILGFLGIAGIGGVFYRKPGVVMDERDTQIRDRADLMAWRVVWLFWLFPCFGPWLWVVLGRGVDALFVVGVPIALLPLFYMGAFIVHQITWSVAVVLSYREGAGA